MSCHHDAASVGQLVYRVFRDIEDLAPFIRAKLKESSEWTSIVNNAKENRANFANFQMGNRFKRSLRACTH
jgi:hypothetical protein